MRFEPRSGSATTHPMENVKGMITALDISFPTPRTSISRWCVTWNNSLKFSEPAAVEWQYGIFLLYAVCFVMGLPRPCTPHLSLSKRMSWYWHQKSLSTGSVEATWVSVWKLLTKMAELYHCFYLKCSARFLFFFFFIKQAFNLYLVIMLGGS